MTDLFPAHVETERLRLERADRALDPDSVYEKMGAHRERAVAEHEHLHSNPHQHPKGSADWLADAREQWEAGEAATWAIFAREDEPAPDAAVVPDDDQLHVGRASLHVEWGKRQAFTGVTIHRPFWGRGYSGERAGATLAVAFDRLDLDYVSPAHMVDNEQSKRAIRKYVDRWGGQRDCLLRNWEPTEDGEPADLVRYTISQQQWRAAGGTPDEVTIRA
ncbi:GNAT family N-acetyltransferase [Haloarchaeobius amylolyticus]|uniref:GNAT family N-acetyltransferase n=1 Tax=Haloarchaeobius amylolyticus TaxID=1198296 RepID=UPI00226FEFAC|nr:GNAT family N-acetyltransferase [Haloarchaeobius amylolyticus]